MKNSHTSFIQEIYQILLDDAKMVSASQSYSSIEGKNILITGANGLIGTSLLTSLHLISKNTRGISIYATTKSKLPFYINDYINKSNIKLRYGDLTDDNFIETLPIFDIIIHTAGSGVPAIFLKDKITCIKLNTSVIFKLFEKLKLGGRFLFISSSDIYAGNISSSPLTEEQIGTTNTNHPRACYIEGKRTGEVICQSYNELGYSAYSIRLALTYGPGFQYNDLRVVPSLIRKALEGQISLLDSSRAYRQFCYISDAIEIILFILMHGRENIYNVAGIEQITISNLANLIGTKLNVPVNIPLKENSIEGAPKDSNISIDRLQKEYCKRKFINLDKGLDKTIQWMRLIQNTKIINEN